MLVRLYRTLPEDFRDIVYRMFLGKTLSFLRKPVLSFQNKVLKIRFERFIKQFHDKKGIEIGGPSFLFSTEGLIPLYPVCKSMDGCNYSSKTIWEGEINNVSYLYHGIELGTQYIGEATAVSALTGNAVYDFVVSSNCLEHVANPIKALKDWQMILKPEGLILLVVPNNTVNFDRNRPDTTFEHLCQDYEANITEADMTHFDEIMKLHDLRKDKEAGTPAQFRERSLSNQENRCFHHHIFSKPCLIALFEYLNMEILFTQTTNMDHVILGRKR